MYAENDEDYIPNDGLELNEIEDDQEELVW